MSPSHPRKEENRHRGLGRGLSALIGDEADAAAPGAEAGSRPQRTVPAAWLHPNPHQPRKAFPPEELQDLANSIRVKGMLQPVLVRPTARGPDDFEIVAGERRWRAAQIAQLHDIPIVVRELSDAEALEYAIVENIQRADLNAMEEAAAYRELVEKFAHTQEQVADALGKSRSHIANTIRLLKLPESVQLHVREGRLTAGHARTLIGDPNAEARARDIIARALNVRDAERGSQRKARKGGQPPTAASADIRALEKSLGELLGLKIQIAHKGSAGGELRIHYRTLEQLDDVLDRLGRKG